MPATPLAALFFSIFWWIDGVTIMWPQARVLPSPASCFIDQSINNSPLSLIFLGQKKNNIKCPPALLPSSGGIDLFRNIPWNMVRFGVSGWRSKKVTLCSSKLDHVLAWRVSKHWRKVIFLWLTFSNNFRCTGHPPHTANRLVPVQHITHLCGDR